MRQEENQTPLKTSSKEPEIPSTEIQTPPPVRQTSKSMIEELKGKLFKSTSRNNSPAQPVSSQNAVHSVKQDATPLTTATSEIKKKDEPKPIPKMSEQDELLMRQAERLCELQEREEREQQEQKQRQKILVSRFY